MDQIDVAAADEAEEVLRAGQAPGLRPSGLPTRSVSQKCAQWPSGAVDVGGVLFVGGQCLGARAISGAGAVDIGGQLDALDRQCGLIQ